MANKQFVIPVSNTPGSGGGGGGSGTVTQVNTTGIATGGPITTSGTVTVAGSGNTTTAATATSNVAGAPANDVVTTDGSGNVQDSGTLLSSLAPTGSPTFTGTPAAPTATPGTSTTQLATTAFVAAAVGASGAVLWNKIGNATADLSLANTSFNTFINQTSSTIWAWQNVVPTVTGSATTLALSTTTPPSNVSGNTWRYTLAATESGGNTNGWAGALVTLAGYTGGATGNNGANLPIVASTNTTVDITNASGTATNTGTPNMISTAVSNSPVLRIAGTINSGTGGILSSVGDFWSIQNVIGSVAPNPVATLTFGHSGSSNAGHAMAFGGCNSFTFGTATPALTLGTAGLGQITTVSNSMQVRAGATSGRLTLAGTITTTAGPGIVLGLGGDGNTTNLTGTSGTQIGAQVGLGSSTGAGNMTFGPTSGTANFVAFNVNPSINQTSTSSGNYTGLQVNVVETSLKGSANKLLDLQAGTTGGTSKFSVDNSGVVTSGGNVGITQTAEAVGTLATTGGIVTTFTAVSDERTKIAQPYEGGLDEILGITPIRYRWNERGQELSGQTGDKDYIGFSAQDVQKQIPEAVWQSTRHEFLCFEDRPVISALVNAVKELSARIAELESR